MRLRIWHKHGLLKWLGKEAKQKKKTPTYWWDDLGQEPLKPEVQSFRGSCLGRQRSYKGGDMRVH
jgi:hypothetical protein